MKRRKAVDNDPIAFELLLHLGDTGVDVLERLSMKCTKMVALLMNFWNSHLYQVLRSRKQLNVGIIEQYV